MNVFDHPIPSNHMHLIVLQKYDPRSIKPLTSKLTTWYYDALATRLKGQFDSMVSISDNSESYLAF